MLDSLTEACAVSVFSFVPNVWVLDALSTSGRRIARELDTELFGPLVVAQFGAVDPDLAADVSSTFLRAALTQNCAGTRRDEFVALVCAGGVPTSSE